MRTVVPINPMIIPTSQRIPNQTTGDRLPTAGKPTSRRKCASLSRSKLSLEAPMKTATVTRRTMTGRGARVSGACGRGGAHLADGREALLLWRRLEAVLLHERDARETRSHGEHAAQHDAGRAATTAPTATWRMRPTIAPTCP
jgi:hypothetical protein